jgi:hypothetical protein
MQQDSFIHAMENKSLDSMFIGNTNQAEASLRQKMVGPFHIHPGSVMICVTGDRWVHGCWQKVADMAKATMDAGFSCYVRILKNTWSTFPEPDIHGMMDSNLMIGNDSGAEWTVIIDNDMAPEPETLIKLMASPVPIISPYIFEPESGLNLGEPRQEPNMGLKKMKWVPTSFLMMKSAVMNCPGVSFSGVGGAEGNFFQRLAHFGHSPWMNTDVEVKSMRAPSRSSQYTYEEREARLKANYEESFQPADYAALDPNDPKSIGGVYMPFTNGVKVANG